MKRTFTKEQLSIIVTDLKERLGKRRMPPTRVEAVEWFMTEFDLEYGYFPNDAGHICSIEAMGNRVVRIIKALGHKNVAELYVKLCEILEKK